MSKELPLWNEDDTDVQVKFRLQFGHVLLNSDDWEIMLKRVRKVLNLKEPLDVFRSLKTEVLPFCEESRSYLLNDEQSWHFIFAQFSNNLTTIYAPHFLFFNSRKWIELNKKSGDWLFFVCQGDECEFFYTLFYKGKYFCNAYYDKTGIHQLVHQPVDVYVNQELVSYSKDESQGLNSELVKTINSDVVLSNGPNRDVVFMSPIEKNHIQPKQVCHAVFKMAADTTK